MVLSVDLGQSGSRIRMGDISISTTRGKLAGEHPLIALRSIFESAAKLSSDVVSLSCTGFNGIVSDPEPYGALCNEFFGATKTALIDDGLAGFIGALHGRNGVVLSSVEVLYLLAVAMEYLRIAMDLVALSVMRAVGSGLES